jgi:predicted 3-demethylubiquinone-9 3-methyltransferase (glyoxalase superfamily)
MLISAGPFFKLNPSVSFLVACATKDEVDALWGRLAEGGMALMDLGAYPFSDRYGWVQDRYGLSWQIMFMGERTVGQKITPTLMFVGEQLGRAEAAMRFYASLFDRASVGDILRYGKGEDPDKEGTVKHASLRSKASNLRPWTAPIHTSSPSTKRSHSSCIARHKKR